MKRINLIVTACVLVTALLQAQSDEKELKRKFQLTFVTPLGTNGLQSHKTTNNVSINILAGVSRGLNGFEVGSIANVILKDVKGAQFAGVGNVVLGEVHGAQVSGYFNYCGSGVKGAQFSSVVNINLGELQGGQFSGFNLTRKGGSGVQLGAYANVMGGHFKGSQISAFTNVATGSIQGSQISAGFNYAKKVKGVQLGLINVADTVDGTSIGFFNFVRKGLHQIELSGDELFYTNLSVRLGTPSFYNVFTFGLQPGSKDNLWQLGYGAGTSLKLKEKWRGDLVLTAHHVNTGSFYWGTSELYRLYVGVEYKLAKKIAIAAGPTMNLYLSDMLMPDYASKQKNLLPYYGFDNNLSNDFNLKGWVGGKIAIRFL